MTPSRTNTRPLSLLLPGLCVLAWACASSDDGTGGAPEPDAAVDSVNPPDAQVLEDGGPGPQPARDAAPPDAEVDAATVYGPDGCVAETYYADLDGDGFGDPTSVTYACAWPVGLVKDASDCDDQCVTCRPDGAAPETCDGHDQDCDGEVDEGVTTTQYVDADGDQHGAVGSVAVQRCGLMAGYSEVADDCDDIAGDVHPGLADACEPLGRDEDCNGTADDGCTCEADASCVFHDAAGYPSCGTQACDGVLGPCVPDPSAVERCDGQDNDCDAQKDEHWQCEFGAACVEGACTADEVVQLEAGGQATCVRRASGRVQCWGANEGGALGVGESRLPECSGKCVSRPYPLAGLWGELALGPQHGCALVPGAERKLSCWGVGSHGQLGRAASELSTACDHEGARCARSPVEVAGLTGVLRAALGAENTCVVVAAGEVRCFGRGHMGQLGNGQSDDHFEPQTVQLTGGAALSGASLVAVGKAHACAALSAGGAVCWGQDTHGELGQGDDADLPTCGDAHCALQARAVPGLAGVKLKRLVAGDDFTCAVRESDGGLLCWGANQSGQLGLGDQLERRVPTRVGSLEVFEIDAGAQHVCARVAPFDEVYCWGRNTFSELGTNRPEVDPTPKKVRNSPESTYVSVGAFHTCSRAGNGVLCWGQGEHGERGSGVLTQSGIPTSVSW